MKWLANKIMINRAGALFRRLAPHLPDSGTIADIGSGTGHNADQIRRQTKLTVDEYDVADLHWVGPGPTLINGHFIPAHDDQFAASLLLFVLQYPESASRILSEVGRVTQGPVIVVQSTYSGSLGRFVLRLREFIWGRLAYHVAATLRLIRCDDCPLHPRRYFSRQELLQEFQRSGFVVRSIHPSPWPGLNVSRDLFVLQRQSECVS